MIDKGLVLRLPGPRRSDARELAENVDTEATILTRGLTPRSEVTATLGENRGGDRDRQGTA
jgi:hypothetical protein